MFAFWKNGQNVHFFFKSGNGVLLLPHKHDLKMANTFILSDETVNSHGFVVKTDGIMLDRFLKSPVMLFNHDREGGIIGKWENIRVEGKRLLADAVFDESDETGAMVKGKVERGFVNSVSIGIEVLESSEIKGVRTVTKCSLFEVSVCDIPSNPNAVKMPENGGKTLYLKFSPLTFPQQVARLLGMGVSPSEGEMLERIEYLSENTENAVERAVRMGFVSKSQVELISAAYRNEPKKALAYIENIENEEKAKVSELVTREGNAGTFIMCERAIFDEIGEKIGLSALRRLFAVMPKRKSLIDMIEEAKENAQNQRKGWTLEDYRKNAPEELRENKSLYERLLKESKEGINNKIKKLWH